MLSGDLQQQSTDSDGLYTWAKRHFNIDPSGKMLSVQDIDSANRRSEVVQMDLTGLKFAKEWTSVMNQTEVGFDVIWESGTIWSFLAENEAVCKHWVDSFNNAARSSSDTHIQFSHKVPVTPGHRDTHTGVDLMSPGNKTSVGIFDAHAEENSLHATPSSSTFNYSRGRGATINSRGGANMSSNAGGMKVMMTNAANANISPIAVVHSGNSSEKSSLPSHSSNESSPGSDILALGEDKENIGNHANRLNGDDTLPAQPDAESVPLRGPHQSQLEQRYQRLQEALQRERADANIAREQLSRVRGEVGHRTSSMEQEIQYTRDMEFKKSQEVRDEVQRRFIETANDTLECHQANIAALQAQHKREVKVLQDDMAVLRERFALSINCLACICS